MLVVESGISGIDQYGKYLVLGVNRLFLRESGQGEKCKQEGINCFFHR
jgi:hypothetical protein